jgi:hypothetical protein
LGCEGGFAGLDHALDVFLARRNGGLILQFAEELLDPGVECSEAGAEGYVFSTGSGLVRSLVALGGVDVEVLLSLSRPFFFNSGPRSSPPVT